MTPPLYVRYDNENGETVQRYAGDTRDDAEFAAELVRTQLGFDPEIVTYDDQETTNPPA